MSLTEKERADLINKAQARFSVVRFAAANHSPFLSEGIFRMEPVPVFGLSEQSGGWAMDEHGRCYYDVLLILDMLEDQSWPLPRLVAAYKHEVWHWLMEHPRRFRELDCQRKDSTIWNIAADAQINGSDPFLRAHLPDFCVFPEKIRGSKGEMLPGHKLAEFYYFKMLPPEDEEGGDEEGPEQEGGDQPPPQGGRPAECMDNKKRPWEIGPPSSDTPGICEAERKDICKRTARKILDSGSSRGLTNYGIESWAQEQLEPPKIPWENKVRQFARRSMEMTTGSSDFTFRRRSRRQSCVSSDVILPATFHPKLRIGVGVDSSASMSDDDLMRCSSEISGIAKAAGGSCIVATGDVEVSWTGSVYAGRDVEYSSRGGTDLRPLIDWLDNDKPSVHCIILLTDGYTPWPKRNECSVPVLVVLIGAHCGEHGVPDWMESVVLEGGG